LRTSAIALFCLALLAPAAPASPPQEARPVTDQAYLGAQFQSGRPGQGPAGIRVNYVVPGSAAEAMGLRVGDQVLELNGVPVPTPLFLASEIKKQDIQSSIRFKVRRGREEIEINGRLGSYLETRKSFLEHSRRELVGKPFRTVAELVWPEGVDGIEALRGKVGVVVSFDSCQDCVENKWKKIRDMEEVLRKSGTGRSWLGFAGIFSQKGETYARNLVTMKRVLDRFPPRFPVAVARYRGDLLPDGSEGEEPLVQDHGMAILDPRGNLLYLELENPGPEFLKAFQEAQDRFAPKSGGGAQPPPAAAKPAPEPAPATPSGR
jgi:hypothetical protein